MITFDNIGGPSFFISSMILFTFGENEYIHKYDWETINIFMYISLMIFHELVNDWTYAVLLFLIKIFCDEI